MTEKKKSSLMTRETIAKRLGVSPEKVTIKNGEVLVDVTEVVQVEGYTFRETVVEGEK